MTHPEMAAIKELLSALSRPRPTDNEEDRQPTVVPVRTAIRLGPILARLRQSDNYEGLCRMTCCRPLISPSHVQ